MEFVEKRVDHVISLDINITLPLANVFSTSY